MLPHYMYFFCLIMYVKGVLIQQFYKDQIINMQQISESCNQVFSLRDVKVCMSTASFKGLSSERKLLFDNSMEYPRKGITLLKMQVLNKVKSLLQSLLQWEREGRCYDMALLPNLYAQSIRIIGSRCLPLLSQVIQ